MSALPVIMDERSWVEQISQHSDNHQRQSFSPNSINHQSIYVPDNEVRDSPHVREDPSCEVQDEEPRARPILSIDNRAGQERSSRINYGTIIREELSLPIVSAPIPYAQILPLCLSRIAEGIIFTVVYPYINEMIQRMGIEERSVGVWSAMAESVMSLMEALTGPLFAPLADKYGRRPVYLICVFCLGVGASVYGVVDNPWSAVLVRGLLGLPAGAGVLSRTMASELSDKSNRIRVFAIFSPSATFGSSLGPILGGFLANPVPRLLSPSFTIFVSYPYLLPSLVAGLTGFAAWIFSYIYLPETLPPSLRLPKDDEAHIDIRTKPHTGQLLRHKPFQRVLILYGLAYMIQSCFDAVYPLFAFSLVELGGLELPTDTIGIILGLSAGLSIFMTTTLFPVLHRMIPQDTYLTLCLFSYVLAALFFPLVYSTHRSSPGSALGWSTMITIGLQMIIRKIGDFSLVMLDAMVFERIPSPVYLVKANFLTFSVGGLGRAIGPFFISYFFSLSTHYASDHPARQAVWVAFVLLGLTSVWISWNMRSADGLSVDRPLLDTDEAESGHAGVNKRTGLLP